MFYLLWLLQVSNVEFERQPIADHANQLAAGIQQNLKRSLEGLGVVCLPHHLTVECMVYFCSRSSNSLIEAIEDDMNADQIWFFRIF